MEIKCSGRSWESVVTMQDRLYGCENNWLDYLAHHGVKGQQWGVENGPPYPLDRAGKKALREQKKAAKIEAKQEAIRNKKRAAQLEAARKAKKIAAEKKRKEEEARAKAEKEAAEKARKIEEAKKKFDDDKKTAISKGDLNFAQANKDLMTNSEINELLDRKAQFEKLANAMPYAKKGESRLSLVAEKLSNVGNNVQKIGDALFKAKNAYNNFTEIYNFLNRNKEGFTKLEKIEQKDKAKDEVKDKPMSDAVKKAINSGDLTYALTNRNDLEYKDLKAILDRNDLNSRLNAAVNKNKDKKK